jgi:hypothetical protein
MKNHVVVWPLTIYCISNGKKTFKYITDIIEMYTTTHDFSNKPYEKFSISVMFRNVVFLFVDKQE